eukprot:scaffold18123_cov100-Isochrysis_galbana.AAC.3
MPSGNVAIVGLNGRHDGRRRQLVVGVESLQLHACGHSALVWDGGDALADCGALLRDEEHLVVGPRLRERHQLVRVVLELNGDHPRAATPLRGKGVDAHALAVTPSCHDQQHLAAIFDHGIRRAARRADASHERLRLRVPLPRPPHNVHVRDGIARPKRDRLDAARSPPRRPQLLAVGVEAERLAEARAEEDRVVRGADACVRELVVLAQRDGDEPAAGDALEGGERCLFYETVSREEHKEGGVGEVGDGQELGDRLVRLYGQQLLQEHAARCARGQRHAEGLEGICDATLRNGRKGGEVQALLLGVGGAVCRHPDGAQAPGHGLMRGSHGPAHCLWRGEAVCGVGGATVEVWSPRTTYDDGNAGRTKARRTPTNEGSSYAAEARPHGARSRG